MVTFTIKDNRTAVIPPVGDPLKVAVFGFTGKSKVILIVTVQT